MAKDGPDSLPNNRGLTHCRLVSLSFLNCTTILAWLGMWWICSISILNMTFVLFAASQNALGMEESGITSFSSCCVRRRGVTMAVVVVTMFDFKSTTIERMVTPHRTTRHRRWCPHNDLFLGRSRRPAIMMQWCANQNPQPEQSAEDLELRRQDHAKGESKVVCGQWLVKCRGQCSFGDASCQTDFLSFLQASE